MQSPDTVATSLTEFLETVGSSTSVEQLKQVYLEEARRFIDCSAVGFYVLSPLKQEAEHFGATGVSDRFLSRYEEVGRPSDPVLQRVLESRSAVHNRELMDLDQWRSLEVYREVFQLHRMVGLLEAPVVYDGRVIGTLNFGADEDSEPFTEEHAALASSLGRLVGMTLGSLWQREELYEEQRRLSSALDLCDEAMVLTDLNSGKRRSNAAARSVLEQLPGGVEEPCVDQLLASAPLEKGAHIEQVEVTLSNGRNAVLRIQAMPLPDSEEAVVCFLTLRGGEISISPSVRQSLTARECDVASLVARGLQDGEIAARLYLSPFTVKQYLKNTYRKLGLRSRVELALLLSEYRAHSV
jgi:DNA-binding CsgD family transcriptional regulator